MKFFRATKDYQIKLLATLPKVFSEFIKENPNAASKIHVAQTGSEFPLFSAAAPLKSVVCSQEYAQYLNTRIFSDEEPTLNIANNSEVVASFPNGYFARFEQNLQAEPVETQAASHFEQYMAPNERLIFENGTTHGRVFSVDGRMLCLSDRASIIRRFSEFLCGKDSDPLAERPEILREMLKTRNHLFHSTRPSKRKMKDSGVYPDFSAFEKSVVQELHVVRETQQLSEEEVISVKPDIALTDKAIYFLANGAVKDEIPLDMLSSRLPGFAFLTYKEAINMGKPGTEPYGARFYLLPHDCVMTTGKSCALLTSMFSAESDKCRLVVLELIQPRNGARQLELVIHAQCDVSKLQMTQINRAESEQLKAVNAFYTMPSLSLQRVLDFSETRNRPCLLFAPSLSGLLYVCYDDEITQYIHAIPGQGTVTINDGDFLGVLQRLEHMSELDRKRYCGGVSLDFWKLIAVMYEKYRNTVLSGAERESALRIEQNSQAGEVSIPGFLGEFGGVFARKIISVHFELANASTISFAEFRKVSRISKALSGSQLNMQQRSVRFSLVESLASSEVAAEQTLPCTTAFCLVPPSPAQSASALLKNVIPSQICCLLERGERVVLACAGFNGASRLRVETTTAGQAQVELLSALKSVEGGAKTERADVLLQLNFENYLRNEILLPMDVKELLPEHISDLCEQLMIHSVIDMKRDRRWIFQAARAEDERQRLFKQYEEGNDEKQQRFVLLVHFLNELGLLQDEMFKKTALLQVRTAFDACSGVSGLVSFMADHVDVPIVVELEAEIGSRFADLAERARSQKDSEEMACQKLEKLSDFEAALSNCVVETGDHLLLFSVLSDVFCASGDGFCADALAVYLESIVQKRVECSEQLLADRISDFPQWLSACMPQIAQILRRAAEFQLADACIPLADAYLFLLCASQPQEFVEEREAVLTVLDGLRLNTIEQADLARVCCRYHDFRRFADLSCRRLEDIKFEDFQRIQLYSPAYADIFELLAESIESDADSACDLENRMRAKALFLPPETIESILDCYKEQTLLQISDPVRDAFACLLHEFEARELNARALTLRVVLGEQLAVSAEMQELRNIVSRAQ